MGPRLKFYSDAQTRLIAERRFIPVDAFAYWLERGQLRDDLTRHAPRDLLVAPVHRA